MMSLAAVKSQIKALARKLDAIQHPEMNTAAINIDPDGNERILWGDPTIEAQNTILYKFYEDMSFVVEIDGIPGRILRA